MIIELRNISKVYEVNNKTAYALKNINLSIERGEIFGIIGESGAGKSTLLRTINLLEKPTHGEVYANGIRLSALSARKLKEERRRMGMVFQHFNLLQYRTAFENIALPLELIGESKAVIQKEVFALLELIGLKDFANHTPDQLSGGQKQRVAIARALATKPHILLCDEPTSALDPKSTFSVLSLLKEINQKLGVTILLITHEMDVIKQICDRVGVLKEGELVESGTIVELFARPKLEITKQLVQKALYLELPRNIKRELQAKPGLQQSRLVRFTFFGEDSNQPFITTLVQKFNISINIVQANIENIQNVIVGFTICQVSGEQEAMDLALGYANGSTVSVEVLGYV